MANPARVERRGAATWSRAHPHHVPNLERGMSILELLAGQIHGLGLVEIANTLDYPLNSVHRIAMTLLDLGYLYRDEGSRRFTLTRKLLVIGYHALGEHSLIEKSLDIMRDLRDLTKETVLIGLLNGDAGVTLEQVPGSYAFKFLIDPGLAFPLYCNAPGKAMLAFLPEPQREAIVARIALKRYTPNTIVRREALRAELDRIRAVGYAVDRAEMVSCCHCVGAPILDQRNVPIAALWTTGPSDRMPASLFGELGPVVRRHADQISRRLGSGLLKALSGNEIRPPRKGAG
jgi:DNA-binding IclR family transcriptional regulator